MKPLLQTYLILLSVLTIAAVLVLRMIWPEHYPSLLFLIPLFYAAMLGVMVWLKRSNERKGRDRSIFFLTYRVVKILLSIVLLVVYFTAVGTQLLPFAVVFMIYYLCLSAVETVLFIKGEKKS
ncbi:MAG: hypothetical protein J6T18_01805 [Bacteroidaceae bacterium]|nr:hypothetical protein [Bacteroidaceae bacterium]MBO7588143.1 hypothetical protein [Bacteroidaceae bacterium]MBP5647331.1 hypothetical protein [Bacteroidaceae bacterium]